MLGKEADGLPFQPYPGELGKKIFDTVSEEAWKKWLTHQTMLINEMRLSPINPEHRKYLEGEMEKFFFEGGSEKPEGYVAPES
jgi:Fe-S cluster biosynthesis and repair protein YggX